MKILLLLVLGLVALLAAVALFGYTLPVKHRATLSRVLPADAATVWALISDHTTAPQWRSDVVEVTQDSDAEGHPLWREKDRRGDVITYQTVDAVELKRLVRRIADETLPFGGRWTFELHPTEGGTRLTITEDGEVYNPIFRFVSRFLMGHDATIKTYMDDLDRALSQ